MLLTSVGEHGGHHTLEGNRDTEYGKCSVEIASKSLASQCAACAESYRKYSKIGYFSGAGKLS